MIRRRGKVIVLLGMLAALRLTNEGPTIDEMSGALGGVLFLGVWCLIGWICWRGSWRGMQYRQLDELIQQGRSRGYYEQQRRA